MSFDAVEAFASIGLRAAPVSLRALIQEATKARLGPVQFCEKLVALERRERDTRNLARRTRAATIGPCDPLDTFDWNHPRSIDRALYESLLQLDFVAHGHNVLFRGQSGVGKTMLAQNLALAALEKGFHVRFVSLAAALADLLRQESLPALERRLRRYVNPDLLVLDELGYLPADARSADLLYNIISRRHLRRATVISTNLAFKDWGAIFPSAACVGALVDRFIERCHVVDIDAESWRHKRSQQPPPPSATPRRPRKH
jgi:DNA replication protein DnaC